MTYVGQHEYTMALLLVVLTSLFVGVASNLIACTDVGIYHMFQTNTAFERKKIVVDDREPVISATYFNNTVYYATDHVLKLKYLTNSTVVQLAIHGPFTNLRYYQPKNYLFYFNNSAIRYYNMTKRPLVSEVLTSGNVDAFEIDYMNDVLFLLEHSNIIVCDLVGLVYCIPMFHGKTIYSIGLDYLHNTIYYHDLSNSSIYKLNYNTFISEFKQTRHSILLRVPSRVVRFIVDTHHLIIYNDMLFVMTDEEIVEYGNVASNNLTKRHTFTVGIYDFSPESKLYPRLATTSHLTTSSRKIEHGDTPPKTTHWLIMFVMAVIGGIVFIVFTVAYNVYQRRRYVENVNSYTLVHEGVVV